MRDIRVVPDGDLPALAVLASRSYPGSPLLQTAEGRDQFVQNVIEQQTKQPDILLYGLYENSTLLGCMRLYDFQMTVYEGSVLAGGVGMVATDMLHKKQGVARDMIRFFLHHYRERGAPLATLFPFRPDFYKHMGFGYAAKLNYYRFAPAALPKPQNQHQLGFLTKGNQDEALACYNRFTARTHGMIQRDTFWMDKLFDEKGHQVVGYRNLDGALEGYAIFAFKEGRNFTLNTIEMRELVYETPAAFRTLLGFFHNQRDQVPQIEWYSYDQYLHALTDDPRNGSNNILPHANHETNTAAVGLMHRIIDLRGLFAALAEHAFGDANCMIRFEVRDTLLPEHDGATVVHFSDGRPAVQPTDTPHDLALALDVAELSSLLMGSVPFRSLYQYGLVDVSNEAYLPTLVRMFPADTPPICMNRF